MIDGLLPALIEIQHRHGFLPLPELQKLSAEKGIPMARISAVATFFAWFRMQPRGRYQIKVCVGAACHVKGAERVYDAFRRVLGIPDGEDTDAGRVFTVSQVACLGCCMLAVAVQIDEHIYGWVEPADVENVLEEFLAEQNRRQPEFAGGQDASATASVRLCRCSSCRASGAEKVWNRLAAEVSQYQLAVQLKEVSCTGQSYCAPQLTVVDGERYFHYRRVRSEDVPAILREHFSPQGLLARWRWQAGGFVDALYHGEHCPCKEIGTDAFSDRQCRIATEKSAENSPLDLQEYLSQGGFSAFQRTLEMSPEEVLEQLEKSGLRGRGGGGFSTALKWRLACQAPGTRKILICNADEGDPGAFMDRMLLESFPYRILEGMLIAARVLRAEMAIIYIREEYVQAVKTLQKALAECRQNDIFVGLGEEFRLELFIGAGAFVCGEETALLESIEGRPGIPRARPPFPVESGLRGLPTLINNVETFACIPWILRNGADAFAALGTAGSPGSKTFALAGKVRRGGLLEVPMGITIGELVYDLGGGAEEGHQVKAVLIGGPSGGCIPERMFSLKVDYEALVEVGAMMGSGGLVVLDERDCMVDIARYFLDFTRRESCGKCTFCREGLQQLWQMLDTLTRKPEGTRGAEILDEIRALALDIRKGSLCGLGRTAPNVVLTALQYFPEEFAAHLQGNCPAGKCTELTRFVITDRCIGCTRCAQNCAAGAIAFTPHEKHRIDQELCVRCGVCRDVCPEKAIEVMQVALFPEQSLVQAPEEPELPSVEVPAGFCQLDGALLACNGKETILSLAGKAGVRIPTLCFEGKCQPQARCMVCAVFDRNSKRFVPACETLAQPGHAYDHATEQVRTFRRRALELLLNRHDFRCGSCAKKENCILLELVKEYRARKKTPAKKSAAEEIRCGNLIFAPDRCILCGRCVGLARQHGKCLGFQGRGIDTHVAPALGETWEKATSGIADELAAICPVGAITMFFNNEKTRNGTKNFKVGDE
jgi:NADH-quinone oxidoreductase subunit F